MKDTIILTKIAMLPESMKDELDSFLDSLLEKSKENTIVKSTKKHPKAGFLKGTFKMSEDFDEPLEDFKEYM